MNSHGGSFDKGNIDSHYKQVLEDEEMFPNSTIDAERIAKYANEYSKHFKAAYNL